MHVNAHALARYAALCQEQGIVPIVEPEVLMDGSHTIERCYEVTKQVLIRVFDELKKQQVHLKGMLLKPNMVISGTDAAEQADEKTVAEETVRCFRETVPEDVPGIVFLSGGQSEQQACENLDVMNKIGSHPWELSFSYGRALQSTALKTWGGKDDRVSTAQDAFLHRATLVSAARSGTYDKSMETI
jgi:fructose-bisphosphate aldolase class I